MDTRRLEAFTKVVDLGSVTRAASVLNIAQPALSQQMISLEAEFSARLLNRSTRGVTPTDAGKVLYRYAKIIMRQVEETRRNVLEHDGRMVGNVAVGLAPWSSVSLCGGALIAEVRASHPGVRLQICDAFLIRLSEMVLNGELDMAVLYGKSPARGLNYIELGEEHFSIAAPPGLLPGAGSTIDNEVLADLPLVMPVRQSFARQMVERACESVHKTPDITVEVHSASNLVAALDAGCGATVLPVEVAQNLSRQTPLEIRPLGKEMRMPLSICIPDSEGLSDAAFAVYQILERLLRERHQTQQGAA
ncbi:MAG: LysR substrate-binding domain-containing protein [Tropicimonas sp.]|uniref:LysR substrate-binding domain-containing protein n=1 Tax=Tropicimonas sp. TaxID=2067044 RepID=UPI003A844B00